MRARFLVCWVLGLAAAAAEPPVAEWFPSAPALPKPAGRVIRVADVEGLFAAVEAVAAGGTILLADGRYMMPRYLGISTDNVTLRSESGERHKVVIDGGSSRHGELIGISACEGVTIAHLTVANVKWNALKLNSDKGASRVRIYDCVVHNVWQRGVKGPAVPAGKRAEFAPRDCRVEYCLFYNDRPKRFSDDETDTGKTFNGNYVAGIDVMYAEGWTIAKNVFFGLQGRTREGRAAVFLWQDSRNCVVEENLFIDCDVGVALGNPSRSREPVHASGCTVRDNQVLRCPETGILACHTRDCRVTGNRIYDPESRLRRLIWVLEGNDGLRVDGNLLVGPPVQLRSESRVRMEGNVVVGSLEQARDDAVGEIRRVLAWADARVGGEGEEKCDGHRPPLQRGDSLEGGEEEKCDGHRPPLQRGDPREGGEEAGELRSVGLADGVVEAMKKVHAGFDGRDGYIAQFGDSITYSMAFWSPMDWDDPSRYLKDEDRLPARPAKQRWRDLIKGARDKGQKFANFSGWKADRLLREVGPVLDREKPMAAIIMIGTNDVSSGRVPETYRGDLEAIVDRCLVAHCVPILNTIPPRRDREEAVGGVNAIIRGIAAEKRLPLVDYHAACLCLRPGDSWDGTLISKDGVHPSGGKTNDYSEENLRQSGYALRNWVNFLAVRELAFRIFGVE